MKAQVKTNLVHAESSEVFVSTVELFSGFGYKNHPALKSVIFKHKAEFEERGKLIESLLSSVDCTKTGRGGSNENTYHLNERQFTLLCLLVKNTPDSVKIKSAIEREFHALRNYLPQRTSAIKDKRSAHRPMMDAIKESREDQGKEMRDDIYMTESKLCNFMVIGRFVGVHHVGGEDGLTNYEVEMLTQVRKRNEAYILAGLEYKERKAKLIEFRDKYRQKHIDQQPRLPLLGLVH